MEDIAKHVTLLFVAVSAADKKILEEEVFVMEKCALDYGIDEQRWQKALNDSFIKYFNEGEVAILESIQVLSENLDTDQRRELAEDLLAIALADDELHEKEKHILKVICKVFKVQLNVPAEFHFDCQ